MTGPPPTPPPKWKTAVVTLVAVFPPVLFFNVTVIPYLGSVPVLVRTLVLCVGVTSAVTWVMMPRLMPLARNWLNAPTGRPAEAGAEDRGASRARAPRRRAGDDERAEPGWAGTGNARPAWLLEMTSAQPAVDPGQRYGAQRGAVSARPPASRGDGPAPHRETRRTPWYGRPPEPERPSVEPRAAEYRADDRRPGRYRPDEYRTAEYRTDEYRTAEYRAVEYPPDEYQTVEFRRDDYRRRDRASQEREEDDYYEEPTRYGRYERARDRRPDTGRQR